MLQNALYYLLNWGKQPIVLQELAFRRIVRITVARRSQRNCRNQPPINSFVEGSPVTGAGPARIAGKAFARGTRACRCSMSEACKARNGKQRGS